MEQFFVLAETEDKNGYESMLGCDI